MKLRKSIFDDTEEDDPTIDDTTPIPFDASEDDTTDDSDVTSQNEEEDDTSDLDQTDEASNIQVRPSKFSQIFNEARSMPEGPANKKYREFLSNEMPTREAPGKLNRLAAVLGGASEGYFKGAGKGAQVATNILEEPYQRKVADFSTKAKALGAGAAIEDKELGRMSSFARTAANASIAEGRLHQDEKKLDRQIDVDKVNKVYKEAQAAKMKNPNLQFRVANGRLIGVNPTTGETVVDKGDASILGADAVKQRKALAEFNSALTQNRELKVEGVRSSNADKRQDKQLKATKENLDTRDKDIADREAAKPANRHANAMVALDEARQDPDNIAAVKKNTGLNIDDFIEYERNAAGQKTKIKGLKLPTAWTEAAQKKIQAQYDELWKGIYGKDEEE